MKQVLSLREAALHPKEAVGESSRLRDRRPTQQLVVHD